MSTLTNLPFQDLGKLISAIDTDNDLEHCLKNKTNVTLDVGKVIKDRIPADEIKLIRFPLKQSHLSLNISDEAFEKMGDSLADNIDTANAEISTGEKNLLKL